MIHLLRREALHALEDAGAPIASHAHGDARGEVHGYHLQHGDQQRDDEHRGAGAPDVADVALDDAVVDDVGGQVGQVEVGHRHAEQQREHQRHVAPVGPQTAE